MNYAQKITKQKQIFAPKKSCKYNTLYYNKQRKRQQKSYFEPILTISK